MTTTCPKCKKPIEHEDYMFEVLCDCGARFNPFMNLEDSPPGDLQPLESAVASAWQTSPSIGQFSESQALFNELQEFAEGTLVGGSPEHQAAAAAPAGTGEKPTPVPTPVSDAPAAKPTPSGTPPIMTAGDSLPGYRVEAYLPPISAVTPLDSKDTNPMHRGFELLWSQALQCGASGVVAVRWVLSPDGTQVVLSGTPVRCSKD